MIIIGRRYGTQLHGREENEPRKIASGKSRY
jgi:hypothetical protein